MKATDHEYHAGQGDHDYEGYQAQPPARCGLNVAGSRERKCQGIEQLIFKVMVDVLIKVNPDCRAVYPPV